jgi:hypothetical protein
MLVTTSILLFVCVFATFVLFFEIAPQIDASLPPFALLRFIPKTTIDEGVCCYFTGFSQKISRLPTTYCGFLKNAAQI